MQKRLWLFMGLFALLGCLDNLHAQQAVLSSGGSVTTAGGSISHSLGQTAYISASNSGGSISQGVQHPFEIFVITDVAPAFGDLSVTAYPNPAIHKVHLKVEGTLPQNMHYHVMDLSGKILSEGKVNTPIQRIPFDGYAEGSYLIELNSGSTLIKSFKIIKHN